MATPPPPRYFTSPRFVPYREALGRISARTGASLPSLAASFLVLHEVTAIIPFIGIFYASRTLGVGEQVVESITRDDEHGDIERQASLLKRKAREWVDEGGQMAERLGKRYGLFGYEKRARGATTLDENKNERERQLAVGTKVAGDVANVVVAYAVTKVRSEGCGCTRTWTDMLSQAILPLRVGLSLYLSPPFSRLVFEPMRRAGSRAYARFRPPKPPTL